MEAQQIVCVFCKKNESGKLIKFTPTILSKTYEVLKNLQSFGHEYDDISLPDKISNALVYHGDCYKDFCAQEILCVFCKTNNGEKLIKFKPAIFSKCHDILKIRQLHDHKYKNVVLPLEMSDKLVYHSDCYRKFSALKSKYLSTSSESEGTVAATEEEGTFQEPGDSAGPSHQDTSCMEHSKDSTAEAATDTSALSENREEGQQNTQNSCFVCKKKTKKVKSRYLPLHSVSKKKFLETLKITHENALVRELSELSCDELYYHNPCRLNFLSEVQDKPEKPTTSFHIFRNYHNQTFNEISHFITENIIQGKKSFTFDYLCKYYIATIKKITEEDNGTYDNIFSTQSFENKLLNRFEEKIDIVKIGRKKYVVPRGFVMDESLCDILEEKEILQRAAFILRDEINKIEKTSLPEDLKISDLLNGECNVPESIKDFYSTLLGGFRRNRRNSRILQRKITSFAEDLIYNVTNGKIKTSKHITLGMALKSLTSSRKVVEIINRYGHCCSYNIIEELETEATFASTNRSGLCPEAIVKSNKLCTGLAFDNFDRYVDTTSGKDTLHDTVGIVYQTDSIDNDKDLPGDDSTPSSGKLLKRRRTFDSIEAELLPYTKKPRMLEHLLPISDERRTTHAEISEMIKQISTLDTLWMMCHALKIPNTPMWAGFNNKIVKDINTSKQIISYLPPINESPTKPSVVIETMKISQKIAEELSQTSIEVTYDLAIAKIALQIQSTEKPLYDNLFIHLGPFHIMLSFFKAIGKFIDDCGLMTVAVDSGIIANGSVNGFLQGKHYNRCKRLHPLMAVGLDNLNFNFFLNITGTIIDESVYTKLTENTYNPTISIVDEDDISKIIKKYLKHREQCKIGNFGKTAQFYTIYIDLVNYYEILSRSIRTGNFSLFKYILAKIANLFFVTNQQNYARWLLKYHDNLLKLEQTHPDIYAAMSAGYFGIQRTDKSFSRQPIDLTLEQTINADAGKRLTGVIHFTNSISARQRWAKSHDIRTAVISHILDATDLARFDDCHAQLEPHIIKKDNDQLQQFIKTFDKYMNPFDPNINPDYLFNIASGKAASIEVEQFLLNFEKKGNQLKEKFIAECASDNTRFEAAISKIKILNFSSETGKKKMQAGDKIEEIRIQRNLFGRLLAISINEKIDLQKVLSYPLIPLPMSLCHMDGTIHKTDKSALIPVLEKYIINTEAPKHFDIVVFDGYYLLHSMQNIPNTFGNISKKILSTITATKASRIDIIFDQYYSPSIKDYERQQRQESRNISYIITGPEQVRPVDFGKELKNIYFKEAFVDFLIQHWSSNEVIPFIGNTEINLNYLHCHNYVVRNNSLIATIKDNLSNLDHEEADTKIVHHICQIENDEAANVLIKSSNTDILMIMLGNMDHLLSSSLNIFMEYGIGNKKRHINISELYVQLGPSLSSCLPGFHALTGCNYNPSFFRRAKKRPFEILKKTPAYQKALTDISTAHITGRSNEIFKCLEQFICQIYKIKSDNVNEARYYKFISTYTAKNENEPFDKKYVDYDASNLPPCESELKQQLLRTQYIASIWRNANLKCPTTLRPEDYGWVMDENQYSFRWQEGDIVPLSIYDVLIKSNQSEASVLEGEGTTDEETVNSEDDIVYEEETDE